MSPCRTALAHVWRWVSPQPVEDGRERPDQAQSIVRPRLDRIYKET